MKRLVLPLSIILAWASTALAAPPGALTTLHAISALSNAEASQLLPVAFEATVTYYRWYDRLLFVQDAGVAISVVPPSLEAKLAPGDRVMVRGRTHEGFRPEVLADSVTVLYHGTLPEPSPASFDQLIRAERDCLRVTVHATVRSADIVMHGQFPSIYLGLVMDGGHVDATVLGHDTSKFRELLDAEVEITGAVAGKFDSKMQLAGVVLEVPTLADVKILKLAGARPQQLPVTPMDQVLSGYNVRDLTKRVRVKGTITYFQPGQAVVLQNGAKSLWIMTQTEKPLKVGNLADATGFPDARNGDLTLTWGEITESQERAPITPTPVSWPELVSGTKAFDLVSFEGRVLVAVRATAQDEYVLVSDGHLFSVIYRHPDLSSQLPLPALKQIPVGSKVQVTGICVPSYGSDPFHGPVAFDILLRSFDDVTIVASPGWLNVRNLIVIVALLLAFMLVVVARGWVLEHRVRRQAITMASRTEMEADLERRRSRILEDINGSKPLASIVEEIAALVSSRLDDVPCWCEIAEGARLGEYPPAVNSLRVLHEEIPSRIGHTLGTLFVAFKPETPLGGAEKEALLVGARLATLAIETRRMNADLLRRSEFDQLTDIHNRFSLGKRIDTQIKKARLNASIFGLIYVDLDEFKQVNDLHGHHIGDLYLQEVARRMKLQLRSQDLLARLGGDEFVALLPTVRNRTDVEEVSQRLEHCFNDPLVLEGHTLKGTASFGIALYPEDSVTTDGLLGAADAAMYAVKNKKRQLAESRAESPHP
jgi:diguanylate cyclase (GGDEF)-like protein